MANLRLALLFENNDVFVELEPMVLKELIYDLWKAGTPPESIYDEMLKELNKLSFSK